MAVRKICRPKGCRGSPRCEHPWWFDVMYAGKRWRMRVDEFALVRGATEPVTSSRPRSGYVPPLRAGDPVAPARLRNRDPARPWDNRQPAEEHVRADQSTIASRGTINGLPTNRRDNLGFRIAQTVK